MSIVGFRLISHLFLPFKNTVFKKG